VVTIVVEVSVVTAMVDVVPAGVATDCVVVFGP
jgi:hypothetical protein